MLPSFELLKLYVNLKVPVNLGHPGVFSRYTYPDLDPKNPTEILLNLLNPKLFTNRVPF